MADEFTVAWNGTMDRQGTCPSICRYEGPSTLALAVQKGSLLQHGDVRPMRTGAPKVGVNNEVVRGTEIPKDVIRRLLRSTSQPAAHIADHVGVSRSVVDRLAREVRPADRRKKGKRGRPILASGGQHSGFCRCWKCQAWEARA